MSGHYIRRAVAATSAALLTVMLTLSNAAVASGPSNLLTAIQKRGYINIFSYDFPPEAGPNPTSGAPQGFDIDVWKYIAKQLHVKLHVIFLDESALLPALTSGRVDSTVGHEYTAERAKVVTYSVPYWCVGEVIAARDDSHINSFADLKGKTVGSVRGTAEYLTLTRLGEQFGGTLKAYSTVAPMLEDLVAGRLDAIVWDGFEMHYYDETIPGFAKQVKVVAKIPAKYTGGAAKVYFLFPKTKAAAPLVARVNSILISIQHNGVLNGIFRQNGIDPSTMLCPGEK